MSESPIARGLVPLLRDLPARLDPDDIEHRVRENQAIFEGTPDLFRRFFLALRDRFHTKIELEMLDRAEVRLRKLIDVRAVFEDAYVQGKTSKNRTERRILEEESSRLAVEHTHQVQIEANKTSRKLAALRAENELLEAQIANEQLQRKIGQAKQPPADASEAVRERAMRAERTKQAEADAVVSERLRWREANRRERDAKIAALCADSTLNEKTRKLMILEIEDEYAKALARGY